MTQVRAVFVTEEAVVRYEEPEMLELGAVEELTFGGEIYPSMDFLTGYFGKVQHPVAAGDDEE